jgi:hypothetical protein
MNALVSIHIIQKTVSVVQLVGIILLVKNEHVFSSLCLCNGSALLCSAIYVVYMYNFYFKSG